MLTVNDYCLLSNRGAVRDSNEDYAFFYEPRNSALRKTRGKLFALADGMGGLHYGEEASRLAVEALIDRYYGGIQLTALDQLRDSFGEANRRLLLRAGELGGAKMGTTLTCLAVVNDTAYLAHVGDTRAYLLRGGQMRQLTQDHNKAAQLVREGALTPEEAKGSNLRSRLTRSLGNKEEVEVDLAEHALQDGDDLVLCSDGVHGLVSDEELKAALEAKGPHEGCQSIIELSLSRGAPDNATLVVVHVAGEGAARRSSKRLGTREALSKVLSAAGILAILALGLFGLLQGAKGFTAFQQARVKAAALVAPLPAPTPASAPIVVYADRPLKAILLKTGKGLRALAFKSWREDGLYAHVAERVDAGEWEVTFAFEKDRVYRKLLHGFPETVVALGSAVSSPSTAASPGPRQTRAPRPSATPAGAPAPGAAGASTPSPAAAPVLPAPGAPAGAAATPSVGAPASPAPPPGAAAPSPSPTAGYPSPSPLQTGTPAPARTQEARRTP